MSSISLTSHTIRFKEPRKNTYFDLHDIEGVDSLLLWEEFLASISNRDQDASERVLKLKHINRATREITGLIEGGESGISSELYNLGKSEPSYTRSVDDTEFIPFFFLVFLPHGKRDGLIFTQRFGTRGMGNSLLLRFREFCVSKHLEATIQYESVVHPDLIKKFTKGGVARQIRFRKFGIPTDQAEKLKINPKDGYVEYSIFAAKNKTFGASLGNGLLSMPGNSEFKPDQILIQVSINGRTRTINADDLTKMRSDFDITKDVDLGKNGHPIFESIEKVAQGLLTDLVSVISK